MSWYLVRSATHIKRRPLVDGAGDPIPDRYGNDQLVETTGQLADCDWDPRESVSSENVDAAQQVVSGLVLYCADPAADIAATDRFDLDGKRWEVDGDVGRYTGARIPSNNFCVVALKRATG